MGEAAEMEEAIAAGLWDEPPDDWFDPPPLEDGWHAAFDVHNDQRGPGCGYAYEPGDLPASKTRGGLMSRIRGAIRECERERIAENERRGWLGPSHPFVAADVRWIVHYENGKATYWPPSIPCPNGCTPPDWDSDCAPLASSCDRCQGDGTIVVEEVPEVRL